MSSQSIWTKPLLAARNRSRRAGWAAAVLAAACLSAPAAGQTVYTEVEPNDSKAAANGPFVMAPGDMIVGYTTGSSTTTPGDGSADYFMVQTAPAPPGIYMHRLVITTDGTAGHTGSIRGLSQSSGVVNPSSDVDAQTGTSGSTRYVQWYGFGRGETIYFRVTGTSSTTSNYTATLETVPVSAIDLGTFYHGLITIDRAPSDTADVDFWVYDSDFNAIPDYGNDTPNSLTRSYSPGTYYIAWTNWNFANDQPAASDEQFRSGTVLDFPNAALCSSTTLLPNLTVRLTDTFDQFWLPVPKSSPFEVVWLRFTVNDVAPPMGACCLANYGCSVVTPARCAAEGGTYMGDGTTCLVCPEPPPGVFPEVEPNNTKATANGPIVMAHGNSIIGETTGSSTSTPGLGSADYFLVQTAPAPPGIYLHRLTVTTEGTAGHELSIRGLTQSAGVINPGTDAAVVTSSSSTTPPRYVQWYGFGKQEQVYIRISGTSSTTSPYTITLETTPVAALPVGNYLEGEITIDRPDGMTVDTDFWVYDANLNPIPDYGNDDPNTLTRFYGAGTYYIAYSDYNVANNQPAASDDTWRTPNVLDFPDAAVNSSTTLRPTLAVRLTDGAGSASYATPKESPYQIVWLMFTVGDTQPGCATDWNNDGSVNSADISAFLSSWLDSLNNNDLNADFDNSGSVNSADISAFLARWLEDLTGC